MSSKESEDIVLKGIMERKKRKSEKEHQERSIKDLESIREDFWLDIESEAYLKDAARILFKDYKNLPADKKRRVIEELTGMVTRRGPPEKPVKVLLKDIVNKVRFE